MYAQLNELIVTLMDISKQQFDFENIHAKILYY
jgi:hypothetical protein